MDGVIIINKPKGFTSHDVVNIIRKKLNIKKVGHTGTLDPNATGVLPILIGSGTKISKYLIEHDKEYIATIKLGIKTDTLDSEGLIIEEDKNLKKYLKEEIKDVLKSFLGKQKQIPPMYSSIKVNGKKLYEYAREGKKVEVKPRDIEIYNISLIDYNNKDEILFKVKCSKGTYIRTLCEDIAKSLETIGYMKDLERTKVDMFSIEDSISSEDLNKECIKDRIISIEELFMNKPSINLNNRKLELFLNGVMLTHELDDGLYRVYNNNKFIGLGTVKNKLLKRDIVI